jgi:hypothetical protein
MILKYHRIYLFFWCFKCIIIIIIDIKFPFKCKNKNDFIYIFNLYLVNKKKLKFPLRKEY